MPIDGISTSRRRVVKSLGAAGVIGLAGCAGDGSDGTDGSDGSGGDSGGGSSGGGSDYPSGPIDLIVAYGPGGAADTYSRAYGPVVGDNLGTEATVRNESGGSQMNGARRVMTAEADGHTIGHLFTPLHHITAQALDTDFDLYNAELICGAGPSTVGIVANPDLGVEGDFEGLKEQYASGEISGYGGTVPSGQIGAHYWRNNRDLQWEDFISYDGSGAVVQAVASGEVPAGQASYAGSLDAIDQGQVDLVTWPRSEGIPEPENSPLNETQLTVMEPEEPVLGGETHFFYAPPDTPEAVVDSLETAFQEATESDELQSWSDETGNPLSFTPGDEMNQRVQDAQEVADQLPLDEIFNN